MDEQKHISTKNTEASNIAYILPPPPLPNHHNNNNIASQNTAFTALFPSSLSSFNNLLIQPSQQVLSGNTFSTMSTFASSTNKKSSLKQIPPSANSAHSPSAFSNLSSSASSGNISSSGNKSANGGKNDNISSSNSSLIHGSIGGINSKAVKMLCNYCGCWHSPQDIHIYDYNEMVDADLLCRLCKQPLVNPLDTKCGHTFCTPCLKNRLAVNAICPVDGEIINYLECQQASSLVKNLLDKLLVICPNVNYCREMALSRCDLEMHLHLHCQGVSVPCSFKSDGCSYMGARTTQVTHQQMECLFNPKRVTNAVKVTAPSSHHHRHNIDTVEDDVEGVREIEEVLTELTDDEVSGCFEGGEISNSKEGNYTITRDGLTTTTANNVSGSGDTTLNMDDERELDDADSFPRFHIQEGIPQKVEFEVASNAEQCKLEISIVGGIDTPLSCIAIQELYLDGIVAKDGRLRAGDQILFINGLDLRSVTHLDAKRALSKVANRYVLIVYREPVILPNRLHSNGSSSCKSGNLLVNCSTATSSSSSSACKALLLNNSTAQQSKMEEVFEVTLTKRHDRILGIKIGSKKIGPGIYIMGFVPLGIAESDARLLKDDRILSINAVCTKEGSQDSAQAIITAAKDTVHFVVSRRIRTNTPDILRTASGENLPLVVSNFENNLFAHQLLSSSSHQLPIIFPSSSIGNSFNTPNLNLQRNVGRPIISMQPSSSSFVQQHPTSMCNPQRFYHPSSALCVPSPSNLPLFHVSIRKDVHESLGMSIAGGMKSQRGNTPLYITNIEADGVLGRTRQVKRGDILFSICNLNLWALKHHDAVNTIKQVCVGRSDIQLCVLEGTESSEGPGNFLPTWTYWLHLPLIQSFIMSIVIERDAITNSLGFSIVGGKDCILPQSALTSSSSRAIISYRSQLVVIKTVVPRTPAFKMGLKCGDIVILVNNVPVKDLEHLEVVSLLKECGPHVALHIVSWPGTIV